MVHSSLLSRRCAARTNTIPTSYITYLPPYLGCHYQLRTELRELVCTSCHQLPRIPVSFKHPLLSAPPRCPPPQGAPRAPFHKLPIGVLHGTQALRRHSSSPHLICWLECLVGNRTPDDNEEEAKHSGQPFHVLTLLQGAPERSGEGPREGRREGRESCVRRVMDELDSLPVQNSMLTYTGAQPL